MIIRDLITELLQYDLEEEVYVDASKIDSDSNTETLDVIDVYYDVIGRVHIEVDR
mgnify:CR=1 FL=1